VLVGARCTSTHFSRRSENDATGAKPNRTLSEFYHEIADLGQLPVEHEEPMVRDGNPPSARTAFREKLDVAGSGQHWDARAGAGWRLT
jgi:hypothetical protein